VELEDIDATLPLDADTVATVVTDHGVYDRDKNTLDINTEVRMTTSGGMSATLKSAFLDIGKGVLRTADPVHITTNGSTITSDSMSISDNGKVLVFEKRVRVNIDPVQMKSRQQASGELDAAQ
jgi:lipopolysaccharide export system protein LptC